MKAHKKSGANAPKDKSMEYKNSLAKKYAGEEATRLSLWESQNDFMSGKKERPKNGAGTYARHSEYMRNYAIKKTREERRMIGKMGRKERRDYKAAKQETINMPIEKNVYVVFPYDNFVVPFCNTIDGANHRLEKNYDAWIMNELQCEYEEIRIETMPESQALTLVK